jgi:hypothetical protein
MLSTHQIARRISGQLSILVIAILVYQVGSSAFGQANELLRAKAEAPPNQAIVGSKLGGSFFAPKPLKEKYDALVGKVKALEREIAEGRISSLQAKADIVQLQTELKGVREEIDRQKTFVPVARLHTKSDSTTFKLGPERRLLIMASKVRIVGWDQPEVKCVLDKTVLTAGEDPADEHFEQMRVVHEHRSAANEVGKTAAELVAEEARYLESEEGKKLDAKGREWRRRFLDENRTWQKIYEPLQGRTVDVISLKGFSHQEGNRQITLDVSSKNGEGSMSSHWQRHAALTVYVPACEVVAVKGGLGGLDIESVEASVIVRGDGDRDYQGQFKARKVKGPLTIEGVPVQLIEEVSGNVGVTMTAYLGNSGTRHSGGTRTSYVFPPEEYVYENIAGDFRGRFVRADLKLAGVGGRVDVVNDYGQTTWTIDKPLTKAAHRVVTHGGQIDVNAAEKAFGDLAVLAVSECGVVRMGYNDQSFKDVSWTSAKTGAYRGWRGFERRPSGEKDDSHLGIFERFERMPKVLSGEDRSEGLDLVSGGGTIQILKAE